MNYIVMVRLTAYDTIPVTADSVEAAKEEARRILRDENRYADRLVRPLVGELESVRLEPDSEVVWQRGGDPLKGLLVEEAP